MEERYIALGNPVSSPDHKLYPTNTYAPPQSQTSGSHHVVIDANQYDIVKVCVIV